MDILVPVGLVALLFGLLSVRRASTAAAPTGHALTVPSESSTVDSPSFAAPVSTDRVDQGGLSFVDVAVGVFVGLWLFAITAFAVVMTIGGGLLSSLE